MSDTHEITEKFSRLFSLLRQIHDLYEEAARLEEKEGSLTLELVPLLERAGVDPGTILKFGGILVKYEDDGVFNYLPVTSIYELDFRDVRGEAQPDDEAITEAALHAAVEDTPIFEDRPPDARQVELRAADLSYCGNPTCDVCGGDRIAIPADAAQSVEGQR